MPQPTTSTPRRLSWGSPVAHRTRRHPSFRHAARIGLCKICYKRFSTMKALWDHVHAAHIVSNKRTEFLSTFPLEFELTQKLAQTDLRYLINPNDSRLFSSQSNESPKHESLTLAQNNDSILDESLDLAERGLLQTADEFMKLSPDRWAR
ncbi:hypothetical protein TNCT_135041 [Trichonephila clavata]|uniref:C2H2-type domain-containing protein n=1 Tax=Trichonephila clavata TaxID=2740835 RepID=A0A8X6G6E1_TRICU|nr:hypothetical protein TNCT_135041 [Trichonephila clavata]